MDYIIHVHILLAHAQNIGLETRNEKYIYICFLSRHFYGFSPGHEEIVVEFINTPDP